MEKVLEKTLEKITPTANESEGEQRIIRIITKKLEKFDVIPVLVGSTAKGTDLRGDKDIDIFIMFGQDVSREKLEKKGLEIGKAVFKEIGAKYEIDYAEHPYVKGFYKDYDIEIVPCYSGKRIMSSVDRTPFHTRYVRRKLRENPALRNGMRLLKQFMKGIEVYGAEAKVQGFSGYLVELLVIHYGSFMKVLKAAAGWSLNQVLDPEKQWKNPEEARYFFTNANLIVIDPVDKNRNVAAAVSMQCLSEFIIAAKEFLENPSEEYFFPKEPKLLSKKELSEKIEKRGTKLVAVIFRHKKLNENSLYSQLRRTIKSLTDEIETFGFKFFRSGFWSNEKNLSLIILEFEVFKLPEVMHKTGPPIDQDPKNQEKFIEKYKKDKPYVKDGRWVVDTKRKFREIEKLMPEILEERKGFGKDLKAVEEIYFLTGKKILDTEEKEFYRFLGKFL